jgi:G3E family GTPase
LGAGKTTAIANAIAYLKLHDIQGAAISNDQGDLLVDTAYLKAQGIRAEEVSGGCFCCRFNELETLLKTLHAPYGQGFVFAESVGSCTDLVATVIRPLENFHPEINVSLSVFADAGLLYSRLQSMNLGFNNQVNYLYEKQLEEADILVVSKIDLIDAAKLEQLKRLLKHRYPAMQIIYQNSFSSDDIATWLQTTGSIKNPVRSALDIDYDEYAAGEAAMAWLDISLEIESSDTRKACLFLTDNFLQQIENNQWSIGHVKFIFNRNEQIFKLSATASGRDAFPSGEEWTDSKINVLINARVCCSPDEIRHALVAGIRELGLSKETAISIRSMSSFKPGYPSPTFRFE